MVSCAKGRFVPGIGLVVEDMHGPVANLQEVDMPSIWPAMVGRRAVGRKLDAIFGVQARRCRDGQARSARAGRRALALRSTIGPCVNA